MSQKPDQEGGTSSFGEAVTNLLNKGYVREAKERVKASAKTQLKAKAGAEILTAIRMDGVRPILPANAQAMIDSKLGAGAFDFVIGGGLALLVLAGSEHVHDKKFKKILDTLADCLIEGGAKNVFATLDVRSLVKRFLGGNMLKTLEKIAEMSDDGDPSKDAPGDPDD